MVTNQVEEHFHDWSLWQERFRDEYRSDGVYRIYWYERVCLGCYTIQKERFSSVKVL